MTAGQNSPLAAVIDTAAGRVFVKGLPSDHRKVITQDCEAAVTPLVTAISPSLLWHFDEAGWNVLGYQCAPGRYADYRPGSPDLDQLVQLMKTPNGIEVPGRPRPAHVRRLTSEATYQDQNLRKSGWSLCHHTSTTLPMMLDPWIGPQYRLSHESARLSPSM